MTRHPIGTTLPFGTPDGPSGGPLFRDDRTIVGLAMGGGEKAVGVAVHVSAIRQFVIEADDKLRRKALRRAFWSDFRFPVSATFRIRRLMGYWRRRRRRRHTRQLKFQYHQAGLGGGGGPSGGGAGLGGGAGPSEGGAGFLVWEELDSDREDNKKKNGASPDIGKKASKLDDEVALVDTSGEAAYHKLKLDPTQVGKKIMAEITRTEIFLHFLIPGRLVRVKEGGTDWGWGVVVNVVKKPRPPLGTMPGLSAVSKDALYVVDTLLRCSLLVLLRMVLALEKKEKCTWISTRSKVSGTKRKRAVRCCNKKSIRR